MEARDAGVGVLEIPSLAPQLSLHVGGEDWLRGFPPKIPRVRVRVAVGKSVRKVLHTRPASRHSLSLCLSFRWPQPQSGRCLWVTRSVLVVSVAVEEGQSCAWQRYLMTLTWGYKTVQIWLSRV